MTAKETLVAALQEEGWDFTEACEHVHKVLERFKASGQRKATLHTKTRSFVLFRVGPFLTCENKQTLENT